VLGTEASGCKLFHVKQYRTGRSETGLRGEALAGGGRGWAHDTGLRRQELPAAQQQSKRGAWGVWPGAGGTGGLF